MGRPRKTPEVVDSIEVYRDSAGEYRWRGWSGNNKVVATSGEGYVNIGWAKRMAKEMFPQARIKPEVTDAGSS